MQSQRMVRYLYCNLLLPMLQQNALIQYSHQQKLEQSVPDYLLLQINQEYIIYYAMSASKPMQLWYFLRHWERNSCKIHWNPQRNFCLKFWKCSRIWLGWVPRPLNLESGTWKNKKKLVHLQLLNNNIQIHKSLYSIIWDVFGILIVTNIRTWIKSHGYWWML